MVANYGPNLPESLNADYILPMREVSTVVCNRLEGVLGQTLILLLVCAGGGGGGWESSVGV